MKRFVFLVGAFAFCWGTWAQNEDDALRYSMTYFGGTARSAGSAGAMSAIGGDFSVVTQNPAGLGRLRKSNFSSTLNIEQLSTNSDFYGNAGSDRGAAGNLSNLSYVQAYELDPNKFNKWYAVQLGMGMTRINSFNERIRYGGSADSSILHSFINEANGIPDSLIYDYLPFTAGLAYDVFAIDPAADNQYITDFTSGKAIHDRTLKRRGGMNEYSFSLSGNYANKLMLGGSLNFTRVKYEETMSHTEEFTDETLWLQQINYTGTLGVEGWGFGLRLGAIVMPTDWLNIGVSAQLPTRYNLTDSWSNNMTSKTDDGDKFVSSEFVPTGKYDYRVSTPFRGNVSVGVVLEKFGSIGAEIEYVDYSSASLLDARRSQAPYGFANENFQIENIYRSVFNYKIGAEARLNPQAYLRGGLAYYASPYKADKGNDQFPTLFYTFGAGYNWGNVFLDAAYVMKQFRQNYYAYDPTINGSKAQIDTQNGQFMLTLGFRMGTD